MKGTKAPSKARPEDKDVSTDAWTIKASLLAKKQGGLPEAAPMQVSHYSIMLMQSINSA
jgi:hypothetical protein